ncbi:MAG: RES domain-containing protein [Spirosomataceae bacterium]
MKLCSNCFLDYEVQSFIEASGQQADCDFCETEKTKTINAAELIDFIESLISNFEHSKSGESLVAKIQSDLTLFKNEQIGKKILDFVIQEALILNVDSATDLVDYNDDIKDSINYWDEIKESLKWRNRFIPDIILRGDEKFNWRDIILDPNNSTHLDRNQKLYRARIHQEKGQAKFPPEKMGTPDKEISKAGRANPAGIPYLYLSLDDETVLYETRATKHDEISIATFVLKQGIDSIPIFDFTKQTSIFQEIVNPSIKNRLLIKKISEDLSRPLRRFDSELDYIPTQFICEYIKVFGDFKGIKFSSSLNPKRGYNIVIFEPTLMECIQVKKFEIDDQKLSKIEII